MPWDRKSAADEPEQAPSGRASGPSDPAGGPADVHLQFRAATSIRLFSMLAGALLVAVGVQGGERFGAPWLVFLTVPVALALISWANGYQVWAYDGNIEVKTVVGSRVIPVRGLSSIQLLRRSTKVGQTRGVAIFTAPDRSPAHFVNSMLSGPDFLRLIEWTGAPIEVLESRMSADQLIATRPDLAEGSDSPRTEPEVKWTIISLVMAAVFVGLFYWAASVWL